MSCVNNVYSFRTKTHIFPPLLPLFNQKENFFYSCNFSLRIVMKDKEDGRLPARAHVQRYKIETK